MAVKWGPPGPTSTGPQYNRTRLEGSRHDLTDLEYGFNLRQWCDQVYDFAEAIRIEEVEVELTTDGGVHEQATTGANTGYVRSPVTGRLVSAQFVGEDALATDDSNYLTFAVANKLVSGAGAVAMLAATDANTTKATGGVAVAAVIGRSLTVSGTAANLRVLAGDVIAVTSTPTGTLANAIDKPTVRLRIATVDRRLTPVVASIAGNPLVGPVDDSANGEVICVLGATNEAQTAVLTWGDQLHIPASRAWMFEAIVKFGTIGANERAVVGLCSAYNATWDSTDQNAWFRLEGDMNLDIETDDATTNDDDNDTGIDIVADTYYLLRIYKAPSGAVHFYAHNLTTDANHAGELSAPAFTTSHLLQPIFGVQKASGTGVPSVTCDYMRIVWPRQ